MNSPSMPAPQAPPPGPDKEAEAEKARLSAERDAQVAAKASGRRSTIVAGREIAEQDQLSRGLEKMNARVMRRRLG
jgi:hypothetical protein